MAQAAWPGLNGKVAWERAGEIWIADPGGGNEDQLTFAGGTHPSWSPDGTKIAFIANRNASGDDVWVMNADGSDQRRLYDGPSNERDPAWSPDGTRIVFGGFGDATPQLMTMNANGSAPAVLAPPNDNINGAPAWSPDGSRIAWRKFSGGTGVSLRALVGDGGTQIVPDASNPNWFPDGSRLVVDRGLSAEVWSLRPDGSDLRQLTDSAGSDFAPAVSPDGRRIVFASSRDGQGFEIYVMEADGSIEVRSTFTPMATVDWHPDWQPVGPPPDVTGISRPVARSPGATLTVDGTGFVLRSVVRWNGSDRPTTWVSPTRLQATLSPGDVAAPGTAQVTVFTSPVGGGLSLPRTATIDAPPPPPPPPALNVSRATVTAKWTRSRVRGTLRLTGSAERGGRVEVALLRGSRVLQRRRVTLAAGAFTRRLALARTLTPGTLRVRLTEVGPVAGARLTEANARVRLPAPPEGVVAKADVSALQRGPAAKSLRRPSRVFARFAFAARPKAGRRITVAWTRNGAPAGGAAQKARTGTVVAFIGSPGGLPRGLYRCTLRAGRTVVAVATVRIT
ncbi:MAG: IPT/TIG domain-containing protein [Thermoleophilia bacterium]